MIQVRNVSKTYDKGASAVHALEGVDLDVKQGELLMLMGPSGSGKTTLLSIIGAILQASGGSMKIDGQEVVGLKESRLPDIRLRYFGFIFQSFNLFPALTVQENVEVSLDLKGIRGVRARQRSAQLLADVGLDQKKAAYPADLSGGQKQRVAIARALAGDPPVILADEPTAALDSTTGKALMDILRGLAHERGRTVVMVTHDSRVLEYADRIVHMEDGRIR